MLSFSTEFPVSDSANAASFISAFKAWLTGSRFTVFTENTLQGLVTSENWMTIEGDESIESFIEITTDSESVAIVYRKSDSDFEWITTIVFCEQPSSNWISTRVECEPLHPRAKIPVAKKPVLIRTLLNLLNGGRDGEFNVIDEPYYFDIANLEQAVKCVHGISDSYLPIVYISAPFSGPYLVDPSEMAEALFGMAHVIVERDRAFSVRLMGEVSRKNVYGGTVALYWPEGGGRRSFFVRDGTSSTDLKQTIIEEIRLSLNNRRPLMRCTLAAVKELKSRRLINGLKDAGSKQVEEYVAAFEDELHAKSASLKAAELEILRLKAEIRRYEAQAIDQSGIFLNCGKEKDFYEGEILDTVRDALAEQVERVTDDGRRQHLLTALIEANPISGDREKNRERIKNLLRGYQSMDAKTKKELEQIGFTISDGGKHFKLLYQADERYTFTLPKSGSDYRGGLNAAGDLCRILF